MEPVVPGRDDAGMDFTVSNAATVDAPSAQLFALITDVDRLPAWNAEIVRVIDRPDTLEPGGVWVVEMHALHNRWNSRSRVLDLDPERGRFSYRSQTDDGNPSYADWHWVVTPEGSGTRVQVTVDAHPRSFWRKVLLSRIRRRSLQPAMDASLRALAEQVTAEEADDQAGLA